MKITNEAAEKIKGFMTAENKKGLRILAVPGGCSGLMYQMGLDDDPGADQVMDINGVRIFADADTVALMKEATIDFDEQEDGFRIDNPNKAAGCGTCASGCHS